MIQLIAGHLSEDRRDNRGSLELYISTKLNLLEISGRFRGSGGQKVGIKSRWWE